MNGKAFVESFFYWVDFIDIRPQIKEDICSPHISSFHGHFFLRQKSSKTFFGRVSIKLKRTNFYSEYFLITQAFSKTMPNFCRLP